MTISSPVSPEAENRLRSELDVGEQLAWTGKPLANRARKGSLSYVVFGIPLTAASVFILFITSSVFPLAMVLDAPFILLGLWMLSAPYWMRRKAQKTVYAITDRRALILSPAWYGRISARSIAPEDLRDRTLTQHPDGSGTLVFTRLTTTRPYGEGGTYQVQVGFENIAEVRDVDALLDRTFRASQPG